MKNIVSHIKLVDLYIFPFFYTHLHAYKKGYNCLNNAIICVYNWTSSYILDSCSTLYQFHK